MYFCSVFLFTNRINVLNGGILDRNATVHTKVLRSKLTYVILAPELPKYTDNFLYPVSGKTFSSELWLYYSNISVESIELQLRIQEVPNSVLDPNTTYHNNEFSLFSSVSLNKCRNNT